MKTTAKIIAQLSALVLILTSSFTLPLAIAIKDPKFIFECLAVIACSIGILCARRIAAQCLIGILCWSGILRLAHIADHGFDAENVRLLLVSLVYVLIQIFWLNTSRPTATEKDPSSRTNDAS